MKTKNFFTKPIRSLENEAKFTCSFIAMLLFLVAFTNYNRQGYLDSGSWICITFTILYVIFAVYIEDKQLCHENKEKDNFI